MNDVSGVKKPAGDVGRVQVRTVVGYGGPAVLVAVLIGVMIPFQTNAEIAMSGFAQSLPIGFAAAAGMVATVNPCGFFILPGYVAYQLGVHEAGYADVAVGARLLRALSVGVMATLGFVLVFSLIGLVIAGGGNFLGGLFPYFGLLVGVVMVIFGGYLLITGRYVGILAVSRVQINHRRGLRNAFIFGVGYGVGSLSCTLPIFLVVVGGSLASGRFVASLGFRCWYGCRRDCDHCGGRAVSGRGVSTSQDGDAVRVSYRGAFPGWCRCVRHLFLGVFFRLEHVMRGRSPGNGGY